MSKAYYPLLADLTHKRCLVIGGGQVAERKTASLLEAGALPVVVSPTFTPQLERWHRERRVDLIASPYGERHQALMGGAALVFAATDQEAVNLRVAADAEAAGKLVNVAGRESEGGFIVPATVRRGKLVIAVSTSGASPGLSAHIRGELDEQFGDEYESYIEFLETLRKQIRQTVPETGRRRLLMKEALGWELLPLIRAGKLEKVRHTIFSMIGSEPTPDKFAEVAAWLEQQSD
ncbi:precorrin-2 dehydrogenase/sirohydrochlorin ferrochelatase family protein [Paenibacillus thalictri]|uniref:precorrin-2 dehydrogenase n=1 Tax=Paenibacillus thalictri TaxID=2527873 RepID=A0A4Q9DX17_9BACL|nr:bifunctional precorrin-2 dehydrogenase/sirohydrochlorin ferrochelatase [Paenibacillus thalictri]TBL81654.1 bifunctional precorrin-2 dehydrogenase/sirohydrochlorin ferrochelatase [Paenibacillus thalictri]